MKYFQLFLNDQECKNWIAFQEIRKPPYVMLRARYGDLICPKCERFSHEDVFERGFDTDIRIRAKGDIIRSEDGFDCVNERVRSLIEKNRFQGIVLKQLPNTDWYAAKITCCVDADRSAFKFSGPFCQLAV